jgi:hypothetical protein
VQLDESIPPLSKIALHICYSWAPKQYMNVMSTVWHLAIFAYTQLGMIRMTFRIPAVEITVVLYHHIDTTHKGKMTIYHSRFLMVRHERVVQKTFMTIIEHTANPTRFQDVLYVFRVGRRGGRGGIGIPEQTLTSTPLLTACFNTLVTLSSSHCCQKRSSSSEKPFARNHWSNASCSGESGEPAHLCLPRTSSNSGLNPQAVM